MMTQTVPAAIMQPAIPEPNMANVERLLGIATEALQTMGDIAKHIISTAPSVTVLDGIRNDLTALHDREEHTREHCDAQFSRNNERWATLENRVRALEVSLSLAYAGRAPELPLTPTPIAPPPPPPQPVNGDSGRTQFTLDAEDRLRKTAMKRDGFRESVYRRNLSRCTGELKRLYHKDVVTVFRRDQKSTTINKKWASEYDLIDQLNLGDAFRAIVFRFFAYPQGG
jgi:hypothetical protein